MDLMYVPGLASFSGSASGALASIFTSWITPHRKDRIRHTLRAIRSRHWWRTLNGKVVGDLRRGSQLFQVNSVFPMLKASQMSFR
jgi:hypothetical protein